MTFVMKSNVLRPVARDSPFFLEAPPSLTPVGEPPSFRACTENANFHLLMRTGLR